MFSKMLRCLSLLLLLLLNNSVRDSVEAAGNSPGTRVPGPDVITGDMDELAVYGNTQTRLGLGIGITSCNAGDAEAHFVAFPSLNHPTVAQNLYRMSGGSGNDDRFEQIGQSWVKHTYGADAANLCGFGCTRPTPFDGTRLGVGCSDTYFSFQSAWQGDLGSRAWVNPFTGNFPSTARDHTGHTHAPESHMILTESGDLDPAANPGATYYAEVQYNTPDEYTWCQTHPGQCNMYNNASYRRYDVAVGASSFTFSAPGETVRMSPAINAWTGATIVPIEPEAGADGRGFVASKVTNPSAGVWHYEYAVYNQNLDRAIQYFSVPLGCGVSVSNLGFHAPLNHPGFPNDGTRGDAGFSNAAWTSSQTAGAVSWRSETFAQNQNANAIRWGTLYNFRFDADRPPQTTNALIGFFKTGSPVLAAIQGPAPCNATPTPAPTPFPPGTAQAVNLSTRMRVQTGENVGIGGFIITGNAPKHVLLRAVGPSLVRAGISNALPDPVLELHGPGAFVTSTNDNWRDNAAQEAAILATGLAPANDLESAIDTTLDPGAYTAIVRCTNSTQGVALVEIYDLNPEAPSKLGNLSTRAFVDTGNNIVIAGFIVGSHSGNDRFVVRGMGPSLAAAGVSNALANPTLELRDQNGALLIANNDWQENPAQAAEISGAGLAPGNNLEAAIAATLSPGLYTALLAGNNGGTGVGLVEVYDRGSP
ncbi:MAG TPA: hypothetical protein VJU77_14935 [Chthoniobacterales bacterium]|nr:hypothetical protein [Chthoniobacterales bacterium]